MTAALEWGVHYAWEACPSFLILSFSVDDYGDPAMRRGRRERITRGKESLIVHRSRRRARVSGQKSRWSLVASRWSKISGAKRRREYGRGSLRNPLFSYRQQYRWCSARWIERTASAAQVKTIYGFPVTELKVKDDYYVAMS